MFIDMACKCGAALQVDGVSDTYIMFMGNRFAESHVNCGFVTPAAGDSPSRVVRKETLLPFNEDDED